MGLLGACADVCPNVREGCAAGLPSSCGHHRCAGRPESGPAVGDLRRHGDRRRRATRPRSSRPASTGPLSATASSGRGSPSIPRLRCARCQRDATSPSGRLHGVPVAVKDLIDTADLPTRYGSDVHAGHRPTTDAACVARLRAAVAHGMVPIALGTQSAASVVRPASFCGVFGLEPTFGAGGPLVSSPSARASTPSAGSPARRRTSRSSLGCSSGNAPEGCAPRPCRSGRGSASYGRRSGGRLTPRPRTAAAGGSAPAYRRGRPRDQPARAVRRPRGGATVIMERGGCARAWQGPSPGVVRTGAAAGRGLSGPPRRPARRCRLPDRPERRR